MKAPHTCHASNCAVKVPPRLLMCKRHWYMVPKKLRDEVWRTYRPGQEHDSIGISAEYFEAVDAAVEAVAALEGLP